MSNSDLAVFSSNMLPSYLKNVELDETTKNLAGNAGGGGGHRISIKGGVFRMMVDGKEIAVNEERAMNVIIVASSPLGRTYYEGTYVEGGDVKPPSCWSSDGVKPNPDVKLPQATTCTSCEQNIKGSGQGESRACRYNQRIAVLLEGDLSGDVYQLSVPATSLFGKGTDGQKLPMQAYVQSIAALRLPIGAVVTEMRFDTASATPKLVFRGIRPLVEEEYVISQTQGKSDAALRAITMTVSQTDNVKSREAEFVAPEPKPIAMPVSKKVAPVEVTEDDYDEPVKVSKEPAPAGKPDLLNLIDEWDQ